MRNPPSPVIQGVRVSWRGLFDFLRYLLPRAEDAPASVEESVPKVVDVLLSRQGKPGLHDLDREGRTVPW